MNQLPFTGNVQLYEGSVGGVLCVCVSVCVWMGKKCELACCICVWEWASKREEMKGKRFHKPWWGAVFLQVFDLAGHIFWAVSQLNPSGLHTFTQFVELTLSLHSTIITVGAHFNLDLSCGRKVSVYLSRRDWTVVFDCGDPVWPDVPLVVQRWNSDGKRTSALASSSSYLTPCCLIIMQVLLLSFICPSD